MQKLPSIGLSILGFLIFMGIFMVGLYLTIEWPATYRLVTQGLLVAVYIGIAYWNYKAGQNYTKTDEAVTSAIQLPFVYYLMRGLSIAFVTLIVLVFSAMIIGVLWS